MNYYTKIGDLNLEFQGRGQWLASTSYYGKKLTMRVFAGDIDEMHSDWWMRSRHTLAKKIIKNMRFEKRNN